MENQLVIRQANLSNADQLAQLYEKTFRETFVDDFAIPYPEKDLNDYFSSSSSSQSFTKTLNNPRECIWIVINTKTDELVGFIQVGPCDTEQVPHSDVCSDKDAIIKRLYFQREYRSLGFGRQLMNIALSWLDEHFPDGNIWLTAWSENYRAQRFYSHYGFKKIDEFFFNVGEWTDREFILKRNRIEN